MRHELGRFASPKLLVTFFVPYLGLATLLAIALVGDADVGASTPLRGQEQLLTAAYAQVSFIWALGIPAMVLTAVLAASAIARESETGTFRILLSKPVRRWEVLLGKFAAVYAFTVVVMVASMLLAASLLYLFSGTHETAIAGGLGGLLLGNFVYALLAAFAVAAVATTLAVVTGSRLETALVSLLIPALLFAFWFVRELTGGRGVYSDAHLHLLDVNYHFGNAFVLVHDAVGTDFSPATQESLAAITGAYDAHRAFDPILEATATTIPLTGTVAPAISTGALLLGPLALLLGAAVYFERTDVQ